jgi:hypothetical protein
MKAREEAAARKSERIAAIRLAKRVLSSHRIGLYIPRSTASAAEEALRQYVPDRRDVYYNALPALEQIACGKSPTPRRCISAVTDLNEIECLELSE